MKSRVVLTATLALASCALVACTSISDDAKDAAIGSVTPSAVATTAPPPVTTLPTCTDPDDPTQTNPLALQSFAPNGVINDPRQLPGSTVANIRNRGFVKVGVDESTPGYSALDPFSGAITGAEVTLAKAIAEPIALALFGDASKVTLVTVVPDQKVAFAASGKVDFTVSAVSMSCARWGSVDFSSEYATAQHKLLVRADPTHPISSVADVSGRSVCVVDGTSSVKILTHAAPQAIQVPVLARVDCLRELQRGTVDAYFSHDSILRSMQVQDPENTQIVGEPVAAQHYGITFAKGNVDLVRYMNAQLERIRGDGTLAGIFHEALQDDAPPVPPAAYKSGS